MRLLYRGSRDGKKIKHIDAKLTGRKDLIVFGQSEYKNVFGAYVSVPWKRPE
jgi:hypothetical protein